MIALSMNEVTKSYVVDTVLENITFAIDAKDKIGLVGINGCGKTTLMNLIAGELLPDHGEVFRSRDLSQGYLLQQTGIRSEKSIYGECLAEFQDLMDLEERIRSLEIEMASCEDGDRLERLLLDYGSATARFEENRGFAFHSEIRGVLRGLGFEEGEFETPVNTLSGGQKTRLFLAKLLLRKPDLLLLDEPTNHLDLSAIEYLENLIKSYEGAVVIISHDRYFLDRTISRVFHIENKELTVYNTNYSRFVQEREKNVELMKKHYIAQQREIKRQEEIIERFSNYGRARYIKQAQSRQKLLDKVDRLENPNEDESSFSLRFTPNSISGNEVLEINGVSKSFDGAQIFENAGFSLYKGDRAALIGANGIGKTTLIKMIMEELEPDTGEIKLGTGVSIGYFDQEQRNLKQENSLMDEIWDVRPQFLAGEVRSYLARFGFSGDDVFKRVSELSGGEKGRVSLLKLMLSNANFLVLDEPTNHLDIDSKEILEEALKDYMGTVLVISHDRYFINRVVDRVLLMEREGITLFEGNYDYFLEKSEELKEKDTPPTTQTKTSQIKEKKRQSQKQMERSRRNRRLKELEEQIHLSELEQGELEISFAKPEVYQDYELAHQIKEKIENLELQREELYAQWLELSEMDDD